jgi:hypothetical protein
MTKKCVVCKADNPNPLIRVCSYKCSDTYLKTEEGKKRLKSAKKGVEKRSHKEAKRKVKPLSHWVNETQKVFNEWVRLDDIDRPCVSCGTSNQKTWDAGHFRPVSTMPEIRFHRWNVNKECKNCNWYDETHLQGYEETLLKRFGQERVDWLKGPHPSHKYDYEYLKRFRKVYRKRIKIRKKIKGLP